MLERYLNQQNKNALYTYMLCYKYNKSKILFILCSYQMVFDSISNFKITTIIAVYVKCM